MKYTAAHWGAYQFERGDADLTPISDDPAPSRIGKGWVSAVRNSDARILTPVVRKGWLDGDKGTNRCNDSFVEVSWDRALDLAAQEVNRVRSTNGNQAIFGGSYGWSSAGRLHHAQSQMRRFLALAGGFTASRETYSHAAAEVLWPHVLGMSNNAFQDQVTAMPLVTEHCDIVLAFGGISGRTAQITAAGTVTHEVTPWLDEMAAKGVRVISIAPERNEARGEWWAIRPGTDTAFILALIHEIDAAGNADEEFLTRCTSGWSEFRAYIRGETDGTPKSANWAAPICDIPADDMRTLARELAGTKSMVSMAWGLQRADHGEQPIWAGLALACVLGQIGKPGTGFAFGYGSITPVGRASRLISWPSFPKAPNPVKDVIPVARIADLLLNPGGAYQYNGETRTFPDIRLVWWTGGNPFHHHQDLRRLERAWTGPETVIVNDHSWTATARRADIVFPATSPLERDDLMINRRDPTLLYMSAMFDPMGEARDDYRIFSDMADRLGLREEFTMGRSAQDWLKHLWAQCQDVGKANDFEVPDWDLFRKTDRFDIPNANQQRIAFEGFVQNPEAEPLGTETGRITLTNTGLAGMNDAECPGHPTWLKPVEGAPLQPGAFHLISGQPDTRLHGQNDQGDEAAAAKIKGREVCKLHPDAAKTLDINQGDIIRLWNLRGACLAAVQLNENMRPDCVSLPTGAWYDPQTHEGAFLEVHGNPNVLTIDKGCSGLSQGNIAHTCVVNVEKWTAPLPELTVTRPPKIERQNN